ncbi:MAG TPA: DUF1566 domain-containing protein [bacterium]|nr:DUF1566 domain-containing protein [bacterium]
MNDPVESNETKQCPHCAKIILKKAKICKHCKKSVEMAECPFCAELNLKDAEVCVHCSSRLVKLVENHSTKKQKVDEGGRSLVWVFAVVLLFVGGVFGYVQIQKLGAKRINVEQTEAAKKDERARVSSAGNWSKKALSMSWYEAKVYCADLNEGGHSDWRLPTISELRTLINDCPATETGGECKVTDSCLSYDNCCNGVCSGCFNSSDGRYSKLGDADLLWSSSVTSDVDDVAWCVHFGSGLVSYSFKSGGFDNHYGFNVRCVR